MARDPTLLTSTVPTAIAPAPVYISHPQLRDLIICPRERGVVNYVKRHAIVEHNLHNTRASTPRTLSELQFTPNTLTSLQIDGTDNTLLAAGGQEADIHLSLHSPTTSRQHSPLWQFETRLLGSINNSVLLTSLSLSKSNESSVEPRVGVSNNDCTVKLYDVPIRGQNPPKNIKEAGFLQFAVPVNHSSISPDGRTLLSVGDSSKVYLHRMAGGAHIDFTPIATLSLPPPDICPSIYLSRSLAASFSTAFSSNGTKFAVASQEGVVVVWDVRSTKPLKVFQTDKSKARTGNGNPSMLLYDYSEEWRRHSKGPGWSVRSVKFGTSVNSGREVMVFTEHTSLFHVVDARTFETEEIVRAPSFPSRTTEPPPEPSRARRRPAVRPPPISPRYVTATSPVSRAAGQHPIPPMIVLALEDTFRIPTSSSRPSASSNISRWRNLPMRTRSEDDVVVIPPMGDRGIENDVQALLGHHGIRARQHSEDDDLAVDGEREREDFDGSYPGSGRTDEEMEVDELESDCVSSRTPSRSPSPSPYNHVPMQTSSTRPTSSSPLQGPAQSGSRFSRRPEQTGDLVEGEHWDNIDDPDLDLAGTCFDPSGAYVYVASTKGVAEWNVRGAEKKWWLDDTWV